MGSRLLPTDINLYIRVVKARGIPGKDVTGRCDPYVEVKVGSEIQTTVHFKNNDNPDWNQVFEFPKDRLHASMVEISVKDKDVVNDKLMGIVTFGLNDIPKCAPPDVPLLPQWYRLVNTKGERVTGEILLAVWMGVSNDASELKNAYHLVDDMPYLYVHIIRAREISGKDVAGNGCFFVEMKLGDCRGVTRRLGRESEVGWDQIFAFPLDEVQASNVEIAVKDKDLIGVGCGIVGFDVKDVPRRAFPNDVMKPKWRTLKDATGGDTTRELMLAVWMGTQADKAFSTACFLDAASAKGVYLSPKLWYLRVKVIEAHDLKTREPARIPSVYVKALLGNQGLRTRTRTPIESLNPVWNEDLMFVIAEPFEEHLILSGK